MNNSEFDFIHHVRTSLILLGASEQHCAVLESAKDGITEQHVSEIMKHNCMLIDNVKGRLARLPTIKMRVVDEGKERE